MSKAHLGFQVREHKPWRMWLGLVLVVILLVIAFLIGRAYQGYELKQLKLVRDTLEARIGELEQRNANLVKKNAQLERIGTVEKDAYNRANQSLVTLQQEILALKEELVFYQGIVSPEQMTLGVNIQSFELKSTSDDALFRYKLVLSKRGKSDKLLKGSFNLTVQGQQNGDSMRAELKELKSEFDKKDANFAFRYFQVFEGELLLPESFEPDEIELSIDPTTKKVEKFSENISWVQALAGGER